MEKNMQFVRVSLKCSSSNEAYCFRCQQSELRVLKILEGTEGLTGSQISIASGGKISKVRANELTEKLRARQLVKSVRRYVGVDEKFAVKRIFHVPTYSKLDQLL